MKTSNSTQKEASVHKAAPIFNYVELSNLRFDPQNPRFPTSVDGTNIAAVLEFMLQDAGLLDLMRSIAKQGFFPGEPLLISRDTENIGQWFVIEGNRRFAACTLLMNPQLTPIHQRQVLNIAADADKARIDPVPCLQFERRVDILEHLGYRHVTGIKEWDPLAKARFLQQQYDEEDGPVATRLKSIARSIGSRSDYVGRLLTAYKLFQAVESENYFNIEGLSETSIDFSLISSVLAYANIVKYLGLETSQDIHMVGLQQDNLAFLIRFIFEKQGRVTRLGESRNIRMLADVLNHDKAREALVSGISLKKAQNFLGGSGDTFRSLVTGARENLTLAQNEIEGVLFSSEDVTTIDAVKTAAIQLRRTVQDRLDEMQ